MREKAYLWIKLIALVSWCLLFAYEAAVSVQQHQWMQGLCFYLPALFLSYQAGRCWEDIRVQP